MNPYKGISTAWTMSVLFVSSMISSVSCSGSNIDYSAQSSWKGTCQTGRNQSPIDIKSSQAEVTSYQPFEFAPSAFDKLTTTSLENDGHSVIVSNEKFEKIMISGGGLQGVYRLQEPHFHWGKNNDEGSEHLVNGKAYPLEMHAVTIKDKFVDISAALASKESDALAVLGVLFEVSDDNSPLYFLAKAASGIRGINETVTAPADVTFRQLLPKDLTQFYRYEGSLTTPDCNEQVVWTVFNRALPVSKQLLEELRKMEYEMGGKTLMNFRMTQPLNGRKLRISFNSAELAEEGRNDGVATRTLATTYALITLALAIQAWI